MYLNFTSLLPWSENILLGFAEITLPFFFFFGLFRAKPAAYRGSQARGPIRAVASAYATATATQDLSHVYDLHHSSQQRRILNPLSKARDGTCVLIDVI